MRLSFSVVALRDLKAIYRQSARQFGLNQADRYRAGLEAAFRLIAEHPMASPEHLGYRRPIRLHFHQSHVIFFAIEGDHVRVIRVLHQHQDWQGIL
jgi:toxin ParE1/3/4